MILIFTSSLCQNHETPATHHDEKLGNFAGGRMFSSWAMGHYQNGEGKEQCV